MTFSRHQFLRAFAHPFLTLTADKLTVIQKKLQQIQVGRPQLLAQEKVITKSRIYIFHQRTCPGCLLHRLLDRFIERMELPRQLLVQKIPGVPVGLGCGLFPEKQTHLPYPVHRYIEFAGDHRKLVIKHLCKAQNIVALILECLAQGLNLLSSNPFSKLEF